jgi:hypothetical protein
MILKAYGLGLGLEISSSSHIILLGNFSSFFSEKKLSYGSPPFIFLDMRAKMWLRITKDTAHL